MHKEYEGKICVERVLGRTAVGEINGDYISVKQVFGPDRDIKTIPIVGSELSVYDAVFSDTTDINEGLSLITHNTEWANSFCSSLFGKSVAVHNFFVVHGGDVMNINIDDINNSINPPTSMVMVLSDYIVSFVVLDDSVWVSVNNRKDGRSSNIVSDKYCEDGYQFFKLTDCPLMQVISKVVSVDVDKVVLHQLNKSVETDTFGCILRKVFDNVEGKVPTILKSIVVRSSSKANSFEDKLFLVNHKWEELGTIASVSSNVVNIIRDLPILKNLP